MTVLRLARGWPGTQKKKTWLFLSVWACNWPWFKAPVAPRTPGPPALSTFYHSLPVCVSDFNVHARVFLHQNANQPARRKCRPDRDRPRYATCRSRPFGERQLAREFPKVGERFLAVA